MNDNSFSRYHSSQIDNIAYEIPGPNSMGFDNLDGGDSVEVTVVAPIVAVIVLFAGVSTVWRYRSCWPILPM